MIQEIKDLISNAYSYDNRKDTFCYVLDHSSMNVMIRHINKLQTELDMINDGRLVTLPKFKEHAENMLKVAHFFMEHQ